MVSGVGIGTNGRSAVVSYLSWQNRCEFQSRANVIRIPASPREKSVLSYVESTRPYQGGWPKERGYTLHTGADKTKAWLESEPTTGGGIPRNKFLGKT